MAIPPQFLKHVKGKEAEGKAEPGDSKKEDAKEGKPNPFAKKGSKDHKGKQSAADKKKAFLAERVNKGDF